jgi:RNA polymerase subunit RPABC4/transcription elongation factor Spt4
LFLWLKRSLKVIPMKAKLPADGVSTTPVRAQFVNGLGMAKKQGKALEVDLESTAGRIGSTSIPAGKYYVDSVLTSSKEFGPVTITARAGGKSATARVDFIAENGKIEVEAQPETVPADGKSSATITVRVKDDKGNVVAPLTDKSLDLKTTLGTLPSPLKWPARATSVTANLLSGEASGTAVITATLDGLKGEGKVAFQGMPKRFCMHCGAPMSLEAALCPKCGKTPPSGTDVKECASCKTVIPDPARFCHHCGAQQP